MIAIIGGGKMGEALLAGLLATGYDEGELLVTEPRHEQAAHLRERYGIDVVPGADAAKRADVLILAVKPQQLVSVLDELAPEMGPGRLVVSVAAGVATATVRERLPGDVAVVRAMPNTPALLGKGMTAVAAADGVTAEQVEHAQRLMRSVGEVVRVPEEHMDAVTALSGSGPAYIYLVAEAMIEAGVLTGVPRATAQQLVTQTISGAAAMLTDSGEHPSLLREAVSSPGGTTIAALRELERGGVRSAFIDAVEAARDRSQELSQG
ncbi:pyrroline-5-carboxylate reductase [Salinactinospora qingdaonensis]|uniref:Pyrroline-5-carboxylate reductase n=1 Tax=Salinactinospora qingdaonensis TaxID=702744 RepID=A0ABP7G2T2_9ACTN